MAPMRRSWSRTASSCRRRSSRRPATAASTCTPPPCRAGGGGADPARPDGRRHGDGGDGHAHGRGARHRPRVSRRARRNRAGRDGRRAARRTRPARGEPDGARARGAGARLSDGDARSRRRASPTPPRSTRPRRASILAAGARGAQPDPGPFALSRRLVRGRPGGAGTHQVQRSQRAEGHGRPGEILDDALTVACGRAPCGSSRYSARAASPPRPPSSCADFLCQKARNYNAFQAPVNQKSEWFSQRGRCDLEWAIASVAAREEHRTPMSTPLAPGS